MTKEEYNVNIWMYYLNLEQDFYKTLDFVEPTSDNYATYSKEFAKQLVSIGSELDIVFKALCKEISSSAPVACITDYARVLCGWDNLVNSKVKLKITKDVLSPFDAWSETNKPWWWESYNEVKHHRAEANMFKKANLETVLNALAALYVLNRYLCKRICAGKIMREPEIRSQLFEMEGWEVCISEGNGFLRVISPNGHMSLKHESI